MNIDMAARDAWAAQDDHIDCFTQPTTDGDIGNNDLMSILSARKYPVPPTADIHTNTNKPDGGRLQPLTFGLDIDHESSAGLYGAGAQGLNYFLRNDDNQQATLLADNMNASKRRTRNDMIGSKEKRRKQIRDAQRAYRLRKESRISFLSRRVSELEQVIGDMSTTIAMFSDSLLQSGVLAPHANLTRCTRETLEKCLCLARKTNLAGEGESGSSQFEEQPRKKKEPDVRIRLSGQPQLNPEHYMRPLLPQPQPLAPPSTQDSRAALHLQCSTFMDQLHMAILYRGYLRLTDASVPAESVRQNFGLLYPAMGRGNLAAYFAAALHAKISNNELGKQWKSVPFFQLGGAGTHYAWPPELGPYTRRSRYWQAISVPLSQFSSDIQKDLSGDWFDMQDLECYLMEKNIQLVTADGAAIPFDSDIQQGQTHVNAKKLIPALLNNAVCLGRSAGFRRSDVVTALTKAILV